MSSEKNDESLSDWVDTGLVVLRAKIESFEMSATVLRYIGLDLPEMEIIAEKYDLTRVTRSVQGLFMCQMATRGRLDVLEACWNRGLACDERVCHRMAERGDVVGMQKARQHGCPWNYHTSDKAAATALRDGSLDLLRWMTREGCEWVGCGESGSNVFFHALEFAKQRRGDLSMLELAIETYPDGFGYGGFVFEQAAEDGMLDALKLLHRYRCPWGRDSRKCAQDNDHPDVVAWLDENEKYAVQGFVDACAYHDEKPEYHDLDEWLFSAQTGRTRYTSSWHRICQTKDVVTAYSPTSPAYSPTSPA